MRIWIHDLEDYPIITFDRPSPTVHTVETYMVERVKACALGLLSYKDLEMEPYFSLFGISPHDVGIIFPEFEVEVEY